MASLTRKIALVGATKLLDNKMMYVIERGQIARIIEEYVGHERVMSRDAYNYTDGNAIIERLIAQPQPDSDIFAVGLNSASISFIPPLLSPFSSSGILPSLLLPRYTANESGEPAQNLMTQCVSKVCFRSCDIMVIYRLREAQGQ